MWLRRILIAVAVVAAALVAVALVSGPDSIVGLFSAEGRRARLLRSLERTGVVVRRSCYTTETFVSSNAWARLSGAEQQRAAEALAAFCAEQGSAGGMTILDASSRRPLARWDGSTFHTF